MPLPFQSRTNLTRILAGVGLVLIPAAVYVLILAIRIPIPIRPLSTLARYNFSLVFPVVILLSYLSLRLPGYGGKLLSLTWIMALFALAGAGLWASTQSEDQALGGLLPWNDSTHYYIDGLNLLSGQPFGAISSRRPLLPGLFAILLGISGHNFQVALSLLAIFNALACFFLVREVLSTHGPAPAALVLTILFFFCRRYTATVTTESLGVAFGMLGFALLWRSANLRKIWLAMLGLLALSLASSTRPGALFVLPVAVLWTAWWFRGQRRISWSWLGVGSAIVLAGFLINSLMFRALAGPNSASFSNFPYLLYGMAVGGKGWTQYQTDHPEVLNLSEADRSQKVLNIALEEICHNPRNFIQGSIKQWGLLFSKTYYSLYSFITWEDGWLTRLTQWSLYALCVLAMLGWIRQFQDPYHLLILACLVGFFISVPFAPPMDANRMRVYAATIPIMALLPALGLADLQRWMRLDTWLGKADNHQSIAHEWTAAFTLGLIIITLIGPLFLRIFGRPEPIPLPINCSPGQEAVYLRYDPGTSLQIIPEKIIYLDWVPIIHEWRFRRSLHNTGNLLTIQDFDAVRAPSTLLVAPEMRTGQRIWLKANTELMPEHFGRLGICGYRQTGDQFFTAQSIQFLR